MKNIKDIVKKVSERTNVKTDVALLVAEMLFEEIADSLTEDREEVRIKNFGTFRFGKVAGKTTKHPSTKEPIVIDDKITIRLGLATRMKRSLNA